MKFSLLICFSFLSISSLLASSPDSTRAVNVGDSIFISACPSKGFKYIEFYQKTRFVDPNATYNKETGDDFYEYFFGEGDFDSKVLPCEYANKQFRIISIRVLVDKNTGQDRPVMFLDLGLNKVAWVELNGAVAAMEVYLQ